MPQISTVDMVIVEDAGLSGRRNRVRWKALRGVVGGGWLLVIRKLTFPDVTNKVDCTCDFYWFGSDSRTTETHRTISVVERILTRRPCPRPPASAWRHAMQGFSGSMSQRTLKRESSHLVPSCTSG